MEDQPDAELAEAHFGEGLAQKVDPPLLVSGSARKQRGANLDHDAELPDIERRTLPKADLDVTPSRRTFPRFLGASDRLRYEVREHDSQPAQDVLTDRAVVGDVDQRHSVTLPRPASPAFSQPTQSDAGSSKAEKRSAVTNMVISETIPCSTRSSSSPSGR